jgi:hypothetical protein
LYRLPALPQSNNCFSKAVCLLSAWLLCNAGIHKLRHLVMRMCLFGRSRVTLRLLCPR